VNLAALPDPLGFVLSQATGGGSGDWVSTLLTATGPAGLVGMVLWLWVKSLLEQLKTLTGELVAIREQHRAERSELRAEQQKLTSRLFLLADRGMAVGQTASEIAAGEGKGWSDPELTATVQRLAALLEGQAR
jgi:hypothetical protein